MSERCLYYMEDWSNPVNYSSEVVFICSVNDEERSIRILEDFYSNEISLKNIIILNYNSTDLSQNRFISKKGVYPTILNITNNPTDFIQNLKKIPLDEFINNKILLDISGIRTPEMFMLLKYLKLISIKEICVLYSIPRDYNFEREPFTSYKSYYGDLNVFDLIGFSGSSIEENDIGDLFIFIGFDGSLPLKVIENCTYNRLKIVNNLPALFPKYKDISVITNYTLMTNKHESLFVPADNPFEVFNMLYKEIPSKKAACIAPLSTKPSSLGVCLYALTNENIKVVYPTSEKINTKRTINTYKTIQYNICLNS